MFASVTSGVARADYTPRQLNCIRLAYVYSDYAGLRTDDRDTMIRMLFRESGCGLNVYGDWNGRIYLSQGVAQFHQGGVWASTSCARLGLAARLDDETSIRCMAEAINNGMINHWYPWLRPPSRWLITVPSDPR
jgi:hypothetical protein